jgi:plasmid maintenance system killer protein
MNWRELQRNFKTYTETDLQKMLEHEMKTQKRISLVERIHQRLCALRAARERADLFARLK